MKDGWKRAGAVLAVGALGYMAGHMDGGAPAGSPKPSVSAVQDAADTGGQFLHTGTRTAQTLVAEGGGVLATGGNAAAGAGGAVQNTVPGAPPQAAGQ